ncbi:hypothetical protein F1C10_08850 [Sphingomonas sp. NBWT7]|uniref:hypothetical protein n=1 Tax=Sphingomonas sp. NBWT7 TaxID=2596913 RepID=UPI001628E9DE|nr:hypothetical protein [Sphingomonas sp. NBWT7]QNE32037.1 hypothetical protein F1C10_08850 [Sphingomonas sp. NBWT7]
MISVVLTMITQTATAAWSPPVQAEWRGDGSAINAHIVSNGKQIPMDGVTALTVLLSSDDGSLRVSPFIAATRGIAFEVIDQSGKMVAPREPIAISPPAPPIDRSKLTAATVDRPLKVTIGERASNLFPKPGKYRVRAIIRLLSVAVAPATYKHLRTNYVVVEVAD